VSKRSLWALAGGAAGVAVGLAAQHSAVQRRRRNDPEGGELFGKRRGVRPRTIELDDGARIFIEEAGPETQRGVVFIHGSCLRTDAWHYQLPGLGDHRLVFYDLRGHGVSQPKGDSDYTLRTLAGDLERVMDDARLDEVVLVGHSVGGMIALDLCRSRMELLGSRVKGAVLLNTTHRPGAETLIGGAAVAQVERVLRKPLDLVGARAAYIDRLRKIIKPSDSVFMAVSVAAFGPHASAKQIDFVYDMLADTPADVIFDLIRSYRDNDVTEHLATIDIPVLVVTGTNDRIPIPKASEHIAANLPQGRLHSLKGCGHMSMLERHRELNKLLAGFFDETLGAVAARQQIGQRQS